MMDLNMVEPVLRGLTATRQGLVDISFVDDLYATIPRVDSSFVRALMIDIGVCVRACVSHSRNYMFAPTTWTQFQKDTGCPDLAATNIQRGRYALL
jgi:hypothetical protein